MPENTRSLPKCHLNTKIRLRTRAESFQSGRSEGSFVTPHEFSVGSCSRGWIKQKIGLCSLQWCIDKKKDMYWKCPAEAASSKCLVSVWLECLAFNGPLVGVNHQVTKTISQHLHGSILTNTQVVRHGKRSLFNLTAIPLGARRGRFSGAEDSERFSSGGTVRLRKLHAVRCVSGHERQSNDYTQWGE